MAANDLPHLDSLRFETAAEHATKNVPVASPADLAGDLRRSLEGKSYATAASVAVCEDGRLAGMLRLEDLLAAPPDAIVGELMDREPPVVGPGVDQEVAAWRAVQHGESALAVVDAEGRFAGVIPPQRLLSVLLAEHEEDLARLGGFLRGTSSARSASEEPVTRRLWHRLPWLMVGLLGAILAANIVGSFETQLEETVILAFFIPSIVYMADAVGTQTEALVIRGLSVGVGIGQIVWREILTGLFVGLALAGAFFPVVLLGWEDFDVALAVSLALFAACSVATLVAMALPWAFQRFGADPAFGSGPLATVVQDLLSIVIYFAVAVAIVG
ncbi:MAG: magnesium transporter [Dehalococcoidia bacterium]